MSSSLTEMKVTVLNLQRCNKHGFKAGKRYIALNEIKSDCLAYLERGK